MMIADTTAPQALIVGLCAIASEAIHLAVADPAAWIAEQQAIYRELLAEGLRTARPDGRRGAAAPSVSAMVRRSVMTRSPRWISTPHLNGKPAGMQKTRTPCDARVKIIERIYGQNFAASLVANTRASGRQST